MSNTLKQMTDVIWKLIEEKKAQGLETIAITELENLYKTEKLPKFANDMDAFFKDEVNEAKRVSEELKLSECKVVETYDRDFECPICLQLVTDPVMALCCEKHFCKACKDKLKENKCPCCNQLLKTIPAIRIVKQ